MVNLKPNYRHWTTDSCFVLYWSAEMSVLGPQYSSRWPVLMVCVLPSPPPDPETSASPSLTSPRPQHTTVCCLHQAALSQDYWAQREAAEKACQCSGNARTSRYSQGHPCHRFFSFACLWLPRKHLEQALLWVWPAGPHYSPPHVQLTYEQHHTSALGTAADSELRSDIRL